LLFWTDSAGVKDAETHLVWAHRIGVLCDKKKKLPTFRAQAAAEVEITVGSYRRQRGSALQSYGKKVHKCYGRVWDCETDGRDMKRVVVLT
jgi:hypothetical protein